MNVNKTKRRKNNLTVMDGAPINSVNGALPTHINPRDSPHSLQTLIMHKRGTD